MISAGRAPGVEGLRGYKNLLAVSSSAVSRRLVKVGDLLTWHGPLGWYLAHGHWVTAPKNVLLTIR